MMPPNRMHGKPRLHPSIPAATQGEVPRAQTLNATRRCSPIDLRAVSIARSRWRYVEGGVERISRGRPQGFAEARRATLRCSRVFSGISCNTPEVSGINAVMIRLHVTRHVMQGFSERRLERAWIEQVATSAEWVEPSRSRPGAMLRFGRIDEAGGKVLRVTTIDENEVRVVITAHFDRAATRTVRKTDAHDV
jgi:hypothetical protein